MRHYVAGRLRYPPPLVAAVAQALALDGTSRLLDLGCGPGFLALAFAPCVAEVVAMDPEPAMLEAARDAARGQAGNVTFVLGSSHDLASELGRFVLVTMSRSFHWMDRPRTLATLDGMIEPGGGVALFADDHPQCEENAWYGAWRATRDRHAGSAPRAKDHERVLASSPFSCIRRLTERYRRRTTVDELVERALSTSTTSPERLGTARAAFEDEIRAGITPHAVDGAVSELVEAEALLATRPPPAD
ncbi:MAG TPA: class I SAM-dependent methyltransferase [Stellaceae bacterium]|nr:class I SAM-dependent methyltransferase [Stellaceae bacterium]